MLGRNILLCLEPSKYVHITVANYTYLTRSSIIIVYQSKVEKDTVHKCSAAATGLLPNDSISSSRP